MDAFRIISLSDGVPGAITALAAVMNLGVDTGRQVLSALEHGGVMGSAIWIGFDRWADQDARKFADGVVSRDADLWARMAAAVPPVPDTSDAVLPGLARALAERILPFPFPDVDPEVVFARRFGAALEAHNAAVSAAQRVTRATSLTQDIAKKVVLRAMGPAGTVVDRLRRFMTQEAPALPTPDGVSSWSSAQADARVILRAIQRVARAHPAECGLE